MKLHMVWGLARVIRLHIRTMRQVSCMLEQSIPKGLEA